MKTVEERWHDETDSSADESDETNSTSNNESSSSGTASSEDTPKKKKQGNAKRKDESDDEESDDDESDRNEKSENSDDESEDSDDSDSDSEDEEQERKMKEKLKRLSRARTKDSDDSSDDEGSDDKSEEKTSPKKTNDRSKTPLPPVEPNIKASQPEANDHDSSSDDESDEEDQKKRNEEGEKVEQHDKNSSEGSSDHSSSTEDSDSDSEHEKPKVNGITTDILHKLEQFSSEKHEKEDEKPRKSKTKNKKPVIEDNEFDRMYANLKKQLAQFKTDLQNNLRKNITLQHDVKRMRYNVDAILEGKPLRAPVVVPPLNLSTTPDEQKTTPTATMSSTPPDVKLAPFEQKKDFLRPSKKKSVSTGVDLKSVRILHGTWAGEEDLQADMKIEIDTTGRKHATLTQYRRKETLTYDIQTIQVDQLVMSRTVKDTYEVISISVTKKGTSGYTVIGRVKTRSSKRGDDSLKDTDSFTVSSYEM